MNAANLQLSEEEMQVLLNSEWILTKNRVIQKTMELFGQLSVVYRNSIPDGLLPGELLVQQAKISRGENFRELPYVMLDFPRFFSRNDVFAIRTMLWWNRQISITLHLKGHYAELFSAHILTRLPKLGEAGFSINATEEEWDHDLEGPNYRPIHAAYVHDREAVTPNRGMLKLAKKYPPAAWNRAAILLTESFELLMEVLKG